MTKPLYSHAQPRSRFPSPLGGEGSERGAAASASRVRGPVTLDRRLPPHPPSLGFASARAPSPPKGEGQRVRDSVYKNFYAALQCAQTPEISITGVFGENPAAREALLIVSATAAEAASPTAPHFSQIRKTTGSPLS
jgi:hypothetical protein